MKLCEMLFLLGVILAEGAFVAANFGCHVDKRFTKGWCALPVTTDPATEKVLTYQMARGAVRSSGAFACPDDSRLVFSCCGATFDVSSTQIIDFNVYGSNCDPHVSPA
ncbi:hypothetical protein Pst134EA_000340 [Puccinia striiformis f. sp. tritici]|uniref:Uncharacterized protein n=1 Tax=Puccinia striiformis f. sp. tritici PST-78 TaxID=1165861 RepID=A0A0L0VR93_9BASI|nr:hypothetical protein Pst134EA_000340 [Puccinia striiformis f. sp. tritici]KAH9473266.1 hypothetical protein Pst134EA_000340 [Puccinia striiformis f. sp. tritici]KNF01796.1 hypothetical protein PSTG_04916 [Puccinia striiformis f. sp. tritici PST-78]